MSKGLKEFSADAWLCIGEVLIDGGGTSVPLSSLARAVKSQVRPVDLTEAGHRSEGSGARWLTMQILGRLQERHVIEVADGAYRIADIHMEAFALSEGGVNWPIGEGQTWAELYPRAVRERRRTEEQERNANLEWVKHATRLVRNGVRETCSPQDKKAAALYASLREFGYLDAYPIAISDEGNVLDGRHRLMLVPVVRAELMAERQAAVADGADKSVLVSLTERIASLNSDRIYKKATKHKGPKQVQVVIASDARLPWSAYDRKELLLDKRGASKSTAELAATFGVAERTVRHWRKQAGVEKNALRDREILKLNALGLSNQHVAMQVGCAKSTVFKVLVGNRNVAEIDQHSQMAVGNGNVAEIDQQPEAEDGGPADAEIATEEVVPEGPTEEPEPETPDKEIPDPPVPGVAAALGDHEEPSKEESKEPCSHCEGTGRIKCGHCDGTGEVLAA